MGRSYQPKYRVEYIDNHFKSVNDGCYTGSESPTRGCKMQCWDGKRDGRPTVASLKKWRDGMNKSFEAGGSNEHISKHVGFIVRIGRCQIVEQTPRIVVCEYVPPMFEVV